MRSFRYQSPIGVISPPNAPRKSATPTAMITGIDIALRCPSCGVSSACYRLGVRLSFPFSAIVGQDEMKRALLIAAVDARIGGVMVFGDRGTGKSTAVRALAALLPPIAAADGWLSGRHCGEGQGQRDDAGAVRRPAARRDRGPRRRRARPRTRAWCGDQGVRARAAGPRATAASSTSTRSICSRIISSTCCSTSPPRARMSSSARG